MQTQPIAPSSRNNRPLFYSGIAALILIVATTALVTLTQLHRQAETRAVITSQNLAKSLELSFGGLIDTINMALLSSAHEISHQISDGKLDARAITKMLVQQKQSIDHVAHFRATNEQGDIVYGQDIGEPPVSIAGRDYFTRLRDDPGAGLYISKPLVSLVSQKWVWIFARRINKADGSFAGVIYAPVPIDEIQTIFAQMNIDQGNSITLRDSGHALIVRYAPSSTFDFPVGDTRLSDDFINVLKENPQTGTYFAGASSIDGIARLHSYYRNARHGFTVNVGISPKSIFAEWRKQAWIVGGLVAAFVLAMLTFSKMISRGWMRQEEAIASLEVSQHSLQEAQKIAQLGQFSYDLRTGRWSGSDILDDIFGIESGYARDARGWLELVVPETREELKSYLKGIVEQRLPFDRKYRIVRPCDGKERWVHGKGELQFDENGTPIRLFGAIQDITNIMAHETELRYVANHDMVTGLPNRRLLADRLSQAVGHARRNHTYLAVCYLDIDDFKLINDRYGHEAGDKLLVAIAERLKGIMRDVDTLARLGGDEFIMLFGDLALLEEIHVVLERVLATVNAGIQIEGIATQVSASIGVTLFPADDADDDTLLRHADHAMYRAKEAGKNCYQLFDPEHDRRVQAHRHHLQRLSLADKENELVLYYQPKVDLLSGKVTGAEALIRWLHPERGLLSPGEFLHYLDGSDLEIKIGEWVVDSVLRQIEIWNAAGLDFVVSANISANHLLQPDFAERLRLSLERHPNVAPSSLELEIIETAALSDMSQAVLALTLCREYGVQIALDDFGTGYSSLSYFRKLPIDILKIDQSFVRDMLENRDDLELIESVVRLGHAFNRRVIAEGVESLEQGAMLVHLGCRFVQGYGIARPMPAEQMPGWVEQWRSNALWLSLESRPQRPERSEAGERAAESS
jgi:diguanylate cyclase (GGDEF)-like protein/PAS domain S-box-containing protein